MIGGSERIVNVRNIKGQTVWEFSLERIKQGLTADHAYAGLFVVLFDVEDFLEEEREDATPDFGLDERHAVGRDGDVVSNGGGDVLGNRNGRKAKLLRSTGERRERESVRV